MHDVIELPGPETPQLTIHTISAEDACSWASATAPLVARLPVCLGDGTIVQLQQRADESTAAAVTAFATCFHLGMVRAEHWSRVIHDDVLTKMYAIVLTKL